MQYSFRTKPYEHQKNYLRLSFGREAFAIFSDYGTGKSKMDIDDTAMLRQEDLICTWLIVTAKGNYATWPTEIRRHMPEEILRDSVVHLWTNADSMRTRTERRLLNEHPGLSILVMNIEAIAASAKAWAFVRSFMMRRKVKITVDESTLIKNYEAVRTQRMCTLSALANYRRIATGNPSPNSPLDLWGQFYFLGGGSGRLLGYNSYYAFRARYCVLADQHVGNGRVVKTVIANRNLEELQQRIAPFSFRARKEDCLDLPPKVYQLRNVDFHPEQKAVYDRFKAQAWAELEAGSTVSSTMVIGQMSKLHQILCGVVIDDDGAYAHVASNRLDALCEVLEESGRQTIIWCAYRANIELVVMELMKKYGKTSVTEFHGGVSPDDRQKAEDRFMSGAAHFMVATPHAGGRGRTWTAAKTVVYYSNTFDLEHRMNSEDRAHRIGQTSSVNYVDLAIPGTLDMKIVEALRKKINVSSTIMGDRWKEWVI